MSRFNMINAAFLLLLCGWNGSTGYCQITRDQAMALRDHINKGNYFMQRTEFPQAIHEYEAALDIDPMSQIAKDNIVLAHNNWASAYFNQRKYSEAEAELEKALHMNPYDQRTKQNLARVKGVLARMGFSKPAEKPVEKGTMEAKKEPPKDEGSAGVVILNPGPGHTSDSAPASTTPDPVPANVSPPAEAPHSVQIMNSPYSIPDQAPASKPAAESNSPYGVPTNLPVRPRTHPNPIQKAPVANPQTWSPPVTTTEQAAPSAPTAVPEADNSTNIEEKLTAIETKLYGRKQKGTIIKRIEKLEMDVSGQAKSGSLQERVEALRQNTGR